MPDVANSRYSRWERLLTDLPAQLLAENQELATTRAGLLRQVDEIDAQVAANLEAVEKLGKAAKALEVAPDPGEGPIL